MKYFANHHSYLNLVVVLWLGWARGFASLSQRDLSTWKPVIAVNCLWMRTINATNILVGGGGNSVADNKFKGKPPWFSEPFLWRHLCPWHLEMPHKWTVFVKVQFWWHLKNLQNDQNYLERQHRTRIYWAANLCPQAFQPLWLLAGYQLPYSLRLLLPPKTVNGTFMYHPLKWHCTQEDNKPSSYKWKAPSHWTWNQSLSHQPQFVRVHKDERAGTRRLGMVPSFSPWVSFSFHFFFSAQQLHVPGQNHRSWGGLSGNDEKTAWGLTLVMYEGTICLKLNKWCKIAFCWYPSVNTVLKNRMLIMKSIIVSSIVLHICGYCISHFNRAIIIFTN